MTGRPTKWSEEMDAKARDYVDNFGDYEDAMPSVVGMAHALGVSRETLYAWERDKIGVFSDMLRECKEAQERVLLNKGLNSEFNSTITKLALTKHGYHDKQEVDANVVAMSHEEWLTSLQEPDND